VGGGLSNPITEPLDARYFMTAASLHSDIAMSIDRKVFYVPGTFEGQFGTILAEKRKLVLAVTVADSLHVQGIALVTGLGATRSGFLEVKLDWLRTMDLSYDSLLIDSPDLKFPSQPKQQITVELAPDLGDKLLSAAWNSPQATMYEPSNVKEEEGKMVPVPTDRLSNFFLPPSDLQLWPVPPLPGFIFGCNTVTMGEALGRGIFGLPLHMKRAAAKISCGSTIYLLNISDGLLFGIFEAVR